MIVHKTSFAGWILALLIFGALGTKVGFAQQYQIVPVVCQGCTTADHLTAEANNQINNYGDNVMLMVVGSDEPITGFFTATYGEYIPYVCEAPGFCYGGFYVRYAAPFTPLSDVYAIDNRIFARKIPFAPQIPAAFVDSAGGSNPSADLASLYLGFRFHISPDLSFWGILRAIFYGPQYIARDNLTQLEYDLDIGDEVTIKFADGSSVRLRFSGVTGSVASFQEVPGSRLDANGHPMDPVAGGSGGSFGEVQHIIGTNGIAFGVAGNTVGVTSCIPMRFTVQMRDSEGNIVDGGFSYERCI